MSQPYIGEIRMFAGNFAPLGWEVCQGQLLPIADNEALFAILGTTYGGDGQTTFALPDLRGRIPIHQGTGQSAYVIGQSGGQESVALTTQQMPAHSHQVSCGKGGGNKTSPSAAYWATDPGGSTAAYSSTANAAMAPAAVTSAGGGVSHDNMQPFLCVSFIISLFGIFPSQ
jgi:microcystin-dependent protein